MYIYFTKFWYMLWAPPVYIIMLLYCYTQLIRYKFKLIKLVCRRLFTSIILPLISHQLGIFLLICVILLAFPCIFLVASTVRVISCAGIDNNFAFDLIHCTNALIFPLNNINLLWSGCYLLISSYVSVFIQVLFSQ